METKKTVKKTGKKAILANKSYGLYYGEVLSYDAKNQIAEVKNCQHVCRWYGKSGGITSLPAYGLCGPQAKESRVGAPCPRSTLTGIVNVFYCTPEAVATFDAAVAQ